MQELILPPGVKVDYRPYRTATTGALMYELQQRQVLAELAGQILLPSTPIEMTEEETNAFRTQQFGQMAGQLGQAIASSGFAFTGTAQQPNALDPEQHDEVLLMQVWVCRHPRMQNADGTVQNVPAPPG